jgi:threonylcarbamoyladenosine tRNA methylthiotransferase MtaB
MSVRVAIKTLGCKLNFSESATLERRLVEEGYENVPFSDDADVYVVNTCAVTEEAGRKCRYYVHGVRRRHPDARIVLMGCYSALRAEQLQKELDADLVLGSNTKFQLPESIPELLAGGSDCFDPARESERDFFGAYSLREERTRSFLKVQDGCDYFCTYCTIPLARGRFRSGDLAALLAAARDIIAHDIREIVLTGVNIGEYRGGNGERLIDLLHALTALPGLQRLRISSIEPNLLTDEIIAFAADSPVIMPHFHIPLQSGCDRILERMHRRYNRALYAEKVLQIKQLMPKAFVAADVIVGFPGETREDFQETYAFLDSLPVSALHVFPYSRRPNTPAYGMPDQLSRAEKAERVRRLISLSDEKKLALCRLCEGDVVQVLVESKEKGGFYSGFSENYLKVMLNCTENAINTIQKVRLAETAADGTMKGEFIDG